MTVHAIHVEGRFDHLTGTDDIASWCQAAHAVETAMSGQPVQVRSQRADHLQLQVDMPMYENTAARGMADG